MQAVKQRPARATLSVSPRIKERITQIKRGGQTYDDVLENVLNLAEISESGAADGVIFLHSISIDGETKKLREPMQLLLHYEEDGTIDLANDEYKILVSGDSLTEVLEDARVQFAENLKMFTAASLSPASREFGNKLKNAVWI